MAVYGEDLAYIHDAGFTDLARQAGRRMVELLAERGVREGSVVDLGCGSGVTARVLSEAGHEVLGIDSSVAALALARRNAPRAEFRAMRFADASIPGCDAVTAIGEVLCYFDPGKRNERLQRLFARVHGALRPGGLFLFDVAGPGRVAGGGPVRTYTTGRDWAVLVEAEEHPDPPTLTRRITAFRQVESGYRRSEELHTVRLHIASQMLAGVRAAGFRARALRAYGAERFAPGHSVLVGRKP